MIVLDDATTAQNPNPVPYLPADGVRRAGDTVSGLEGILDQGQINSDTSIIDYRIQPTKAPTFSSDNARTAAPAAVGGNLKVGFFNVLNYFTTLDDANAPPGLEPRGANTAAEFDRQRTKIFAAMSAINADVFGLSEIENLPGTHAVQNLVDGLNAYVGDPGRYAAVADPATGTGTDAIKVALIYQPAKVATVGDSMSDPDPINNRAPIAQTFRLLANGETVNVVVNHLKSKGSCPTATDPDARATPTAATVRAAGTPGACSRPSGLLTFIDTVKTTSGDPDVLAIGDFNSYGHEDPIETLTAAGLHNELEPLRRCRRLLLRVRRPVRLSRPRARDRVGGRTGGRRSGVAHQRRRAVGHRLQHGVQARRPLHTDALPLVRPRPRRARRRPGRLPFSDDARPARAHR